MIRNDSPIDTSIRFFTGRNFFMSYRLLGGAPRYAICGILARPNMVCQETGVQLTSCLPDRSQPSPNANRFRPSQGFAGPRRSPRAFASGCATLLVTAPDVRRAGARLALARDRVSGKSDRGSLRPKPDVAVEP